MKPLLMAVMIALLAFTTGYAQGTRAQDPASATVYLEISRASPHGGTIKGLYNGTAVEGTYSGTPVEGTFTLKANGMVLAHGSYTCNPSGCVFTGK